jgi:hypothetical protein
VRQVPGNSYAGGAAVSTPQAALQQPTAAGLAAGAAVPKPFWRRLFWRRSACAPSVTTGQLYKLKQAVGGNA